MRVIQATDVYNTLFDPVHETAVRIATMMGIKSNQGPRYSVLADAGNRNGDFLFVPATAAAPPAT